MKSTLLCCTFIIILLLFFTGGFPGKGHCLETDFQEWIKSFEPENQASKYAYGRGRTFETWCESFETRFSVEKRDFYSFSSDFEGWKKSFDITGKNKFLTEKELLNAVLLILIISGSYEPDESDKSNFYGGNHSVVPEKSKDEMALIFLLMCLLNEISD